MAGLPPAPGPPSAILRSAREASEGGAPDRLDLHRQTEDKFPEISADFPPAPNRRPVARRRTTARSQDTSAIGQERVRPAESDGVATPSLRPLRRPDGPSSAIAGEIFLTRVTALECGLSRPVVAGEALAGRGRVPRR